jgi:hypothetical protein
MSIDTAVEEMIQNHIDALGLDEQDFVSRLDAEQYTDSAVAEVEDEVAQLEQRIEYLEKKLLPAAEDETEEPLDAWLGPKYTEEPRAVNQIDWIMTTHGLIAGYDSKAMLESYVRSVLPADQSHQAEMLIAMVLTTARNLINKKLEAES